MEFGKHAFKVCAVFAVLFIVGLIFKMLGVFYDVEQFKVNNNNNNNNNNKNNNKKTNANELFISNLIPKTESAFKEKAKMFYGDYNGQSFGDILSKNIEALLTTEQKKWLKEVKNDIKNK